VIEEKRGDKSCRIERAQITQKDTEMGAWKKWRNGDEKRERGERTTITIKTQVADEGRAEGEGAGKGKNCAKKKIGR
jgi:hypothetical protein